MSKETWEKGGKYYQTWKNYTVAACGSGGRTKSGWQFTAYQGSNNLLGVFEKASEAKKCCIDHFNNK